MRLRLLLVGILTILSAVPAWADTATLTWPAPTDPSVTGFKVYRGTVSGQYGTPVDVGKVTTYTVTLPTLTVDQTYFFAITDYNAAGESGKSNEVSKLIKGIPVVPQTTFPLQFTGTVGEVHSLSLPVTIPANATGASLVINCFDCDHADWGTLSINGGAALPMWAPLGVGNASATITVPVSVSSLVSGTNTFSFTQTSNYGGPRIDGMAVNFAVPVVIPTPIPAPIPTPPQGLVISSATPQQIVITASLQDCPVLLTSTKGSTNTVLQRTFTCTQ